MVARPRRRSSMTVDFSWDEQLYEKLTAENEEELETFQKEEDEAAESAGDTEVQAARGKRAEFWARVGDKVGASWSINVLDSPTNYLIFAGESTFVVRSRLRKDRRTGNQNRPCPRNHPHWHLLRGQIRCKEEHRQS